MLEFCVLLAIIYSNVYPSTFPFGGVACLSRKRSKKTFQTPDQITMAQILYIYRIELPSPQSDTDACNKII